MGYRKFKFSSYVIAGQGIGLRVILPFATLMSIICGVGLYLLITMPYNDIINGLKTLPDFRVSYGKIVEPFEKEKVVDISEDYSVTINTAVAKANPDELQPDTFMYITSSEVWIQFGMFIADCPLISEKVRERLQHAFAPIDLKNVKSGTYNVERELTRIVSMFKLFCVFIAVQMFLTILITFLAIWLFVCFLELILKHGLTNGQLGRLLTMPYCILVGAAIILGLLMKSWFVPWFLFMPYISLNVYLIAMVIPLFGDLISAAYSTFSFPFLMKLGWIAGMPLLLVWYFIWVGSIRIARERQKEFIKQMNTKAKPKEETEEESAE